MPPVSKEQAKAKVAVLLAAGATVPAAMEGVGRSRKTYENWRAEDPAFGQACDAARGRAQKAKQAGQDPELRTLGFAEWRRRFVGRETYPHQQMWIEALEGGEVVPYHPSITYEKGTNSRLICINTPPYHSKSSTITIEYVTYKLCMNPAFRVIIVSKTAEAASKFLFSIRTMLTDPHYAEMHAAYAPSGSFRPERGEGRWGNNLIYLAGRNADAVDRAAKDPSVEALGIDGQVYGSRADLVILDDAVTDGNAQHYEKQLSWLNRTVMSRAKQGKILLVGTRVAPTDLYSYATNGDNYTSGKNPWTYIAQPAVLDFAEDPKDWVTLWPKSRQPLDEAGGEEPDENGEYTAWDGTALETVRSSNRPGVWGLVYMQQQVSEDMTFHPVAVNGCIDRRRKPGPLKAGAWGHPAEGAEGMQVIGSIDPAGTGEAFVMVMAYDRVTKHRWVLNAWMGTNTKPSWYRERMESITPEYGVSEWVIESNAYSSWLIHDEGVTSWAQQHGIRVTPHFTAKNKQDPDFGVATMAGLFGTMQEKHAGGERVHQRDGIIHLPDPDYSPGIKALVDQLLIWVPGKRSSRLRQDGPMALWFAELRCRAYALGFRKEVTTHSVTRFTTDRSRRRMAVTYQQ